MILVLLACADASGASGSERLLAYFTPEDVARGNAYMHGRYWLYAAGTALRLAVLALLIVTPASAALRNLAVRLAPAHPTLAVAAYLAILLVAFELLLLPLAYYSGFVREHAFGLSTQTAAGWLLDRAKGMLVSLALGVPVGVLVVTLWRKYPGRWVLPAWALAALTTVLLVALAPVVIDPLFNTIRPVQDAELRSRVLGLAARADLPVSQVYETDASRRTRKGNAYFTGLGATKRIVLYDTLVRGSQPEEVELILAHEMGHWKHAHIWQGLFLSVLALGAVLWAGARAMEWAARRPALHLTGPADVAGVPVFLLTVYLLSFLSLPVQTAISRHFERQADRASLVLTGNPAAFIRAEVSLARSNLADLTPPAPLVWLLYTHPPVLERIRMAEEFKTTMTSQ
jgi:STE24 endopeptidase